MKEVQGNPQGTNPKVKQFLDELSEIHEEIFSRYQLELIPTIKIKPTGITPTWAVVERMPVKKTAKTKKKAKKVVKSSKRKAKK